MASWAGSIEVGYSRDEFVAVTGYHRKHAMRVLRSGVAGSRYGARPGRRIYDEAAREALILLKEASDRVCGKRLKALLPVLTEAMERHGRLELDPVVRARVLAMSADTIDRRGGGAQRPRRAYAVRYGCGRSPTGAIRGPVLWKPTWSYRAAHLCTDPGFDRYREWLDGMRTVAGARAAPVDGGP
jgi:hypothetical protein